MSIERKYDWACFILVAVLAGVLMARALGFLRAPQGAGEVWLLVLLWLLAVIALLQRYIRELVITLGLLKTEIRTLTQETREGLGEVKDGQRSTKRDVASISTRIDSMISSINTINAHVSVSPHITTQVGSAAGPELIMSTVAYVALQTLTRVSGFTSVGAQQTMEVRTQLQELHRRGCLMNRSEAAKLIPNIVDALNVLPLSEEERQQIAPWLGFLQQLGQELAAELNSAE